MVSTANRKRHLSFFSKCLYTQPSTGRFFNLLTFEPHFALEANSSAYKADASPYTLMRHYFLSLVMICITISTKTININAYINIINKYRCGEEGSRTLCGYVLQTFRLTLSITPILFSTLPVSGQWKYNSLTRGTRRTRTFELERGLIYSQLPLPLGDNPKYRMVFFRFTSEFWLL